MGIALSRTVSCRTGYNQVALITTDVNCQSTGAMRMVAKALTTRFQSHRTKLVHLATFMVLAVSSNCLAADSAPRELPVQVAKKIAMQTKLVQQLWKGQ